jgi:hypothetical protein
LTLVVSKKKKGCISHRKNCTRWECGIALGNKSNMSTQECARFGAISFARTKPDFNGYFQFFGLTIVTCQKLENSKSSLKQDYSAPSMGGVVGTISFDVANHRCPLDSSIRENCSVICYTSSASRRNILVSQSSPTNHMSKALVGAGVLSALRPFEP